MCVRMYVLYHSFGLVHAYVCCLQILELLWSMAHTPQLSPEMAEQALDAHCSILVDSTHSKDAERKLYIGKCVEDIKKVKTTPCLVCCPTVSGWVQSFHGSGRGHIIGGGRGHFMWVP